MNRDRNLIDIFGSGTNMALRLTVGIGAEYEERPLG